MSGFKMINGISMYYEIYSDGEPLVLIHGGGSTIQTTFGRAIPHFPKERQLICVELQAHGRTGDRDSPISFEQDADDVAALLNNLGIEKADILGFSNGGNTAIQMAIRHPQLCNKIIAASALLKRDGAAPEFWEFMKNGTFEDMPQSYKDAFLKVNPDSAALINMYEKCAFRMNHFQEFSDEQLNSIQHPVLLINGEMDVASSEHMGEMSRMIPNCVLRIIPGGHGAYLGEITAPERDFNGNIPVISIIEQFLGKV